MARKSYCIRLDEERVAELKRLYFEYYEIKGFSGTSVHYSLSEILNYALLDDIVILEMAIKDLKENK